MIPNLEEFVFHPRKSTEEESDKLCIKNLESCKSLQKLSLGDVTIENLDDIILNKKISTKLSQVILKDLGIENINIKSLSELSCLQELTIDDSYYDEETLATDISHYQQFKKTTHHSF